MKPLFLSLLFSLSFCYSPAQQDTEFWFVCPEVSQTGGLNLDRPIFLRMTAFASAASVTISQPAGGGFPTTVVAIPANSTVSFDLTPWINVLENKPPNTVLNFGLHIVATTPISAYYHVVSGACLCNPEDFVLKGSNAVGVDFWIPGQNVLNNDPGYTPTPHNAFDIVATQNATTVTITPAQAIAGHAAGATFTVVLNAGQTYCAEAASTLAANHLAGSRVTSDKPIAITEKDDLLGYTSLGVYGADLIGDQIVPTNVLGTQYIPMYGGLTAPGDRLFITATQPGTTISLNGTYVTTIGAGATYMMFCPSPSGYVQTNNPVYVYQLSGIHSEVGSALLPQINCTGSNTVSIQQSSTIDFKLNLLVKTVGTGSFLVNGAAGVITSGMFTIVPATGGIWSSAQVTMPVASYPIGSVLNIANAGNLFQMGYLSSGPPNSGADFGYFSNYGGINPNPNGTTNICDGDSLKLYADSFGLATYLWSGPGGFISTLENPFIPGSVSPDSGTYKVIVHTPGCTDSGTISIAVHPYPDVNLGNDTLVCGAASLILQDLDAVYASDTFLWSNTSTTPTITVTTGGTYWVKVTNAVCSKTDTIHVSIVPLTYPIVTPVSYCQFAHAVPLTATGTGLKWYTAATGGTGNPMAPTPSTLTAGTTTYYVTSSSGPCESARIPVTVTIHPKPNPPAPSTASYCQFRTPVQVANVPGTTGGILTWYGPGVTAGTTIAPTPNTYIAPDTILYYVTETSTPFGCVSDSATDKVIIKLKPQPPLTRNVQYCENYPGARPLNEAVDSEYNSRLNWYYHAGPVPPIPVPPTNAGPGTKVWWVSQTVPATPDGCESDSAAIYVTIVPKPVFGIHASKPWVCQYDSIQLAYCCGPSLFEPFYYWTLPRGAFAASGTNIGDSIITVKFDSANQDNIVKLRAFNDSGFCYSDTFIHISVIPQPNAVAYSKPDVCLGDTVQLALATRSIGAYSFEWYVDATTIYDSHALGIITNNTAGTAGPFMITWVDSGLHIIKVYTSTIEGCKSEPTFDSVEVHTVPDATFYISSTVGANTLCLEDSIQLSAHTANYSYAYEWSPSDFFNNENKPVIWGRLRQDKSVITLRVTDPFGCYATSNMAIDPASCCTVLFPNAFTPNGAGPAENNVFRPYSSGHHLFHIFHIVNRWGQTVFESANSQDAAWDGRYNGIPQDMDVYYYYVKYDCDGKAIEKKGDVTLVR